MGTLREYVRTFTIISALLLEIEMFLTKVIEKINTFYIQ
jgi:hypothetical protein